MNVVGQKIPIVTIQLATGQFKYDVFVNGNDIKTPVSILFAVMWRVFVATGDVICLQVHRLKYRYALSLNNVADLDEVLEEVQRLVCNPP